MKKNLLLALVLIFGFTAVSHAQLKEGNIMLGADLGSGLSTSTNGGLLGFNIGLNNDSGYNIGINPKGGYFFRDNFLGGAIVNLGFSDSGGDNPVQTFVYGVQALGRFYVAPSDVDLEDEVPAGQFYVETHAGIAGVNMDGGDDTNGFAFGFGPGYSLFLNRYVALEGSVKYNGLAGGGNEDYQQSLGINVGVQVFLPFSEAEDTAEGF